MESDVKFIVHGLCLRKNFSIFCYCAGKGTAVWPPRNASSGFSGSLLEEELALCPLRPALSISLSLPLFVSLSLSEPARSQL